MSQRHAAILAFLSALIVLVEPAQAQMEAAFDVDGKSRLHATVTDGDFYYDISVEPSATIQLLSDWSLTVIARAFADGGDRLEPGRPRQNSRSSFNRRLLVGDQLELDLREAYLAGYVGPAFLTIGKQQIVWGKADRIRVLDIVNPHSFREFFLPSFEQSRIPLWSVRAEAPVGPLQAETVFIPDRTYAEFPEAGGAFALTAAQFNPPEPLTGQPPTLAPAVNRRGGFDYGLRLSGLVAGWDVAALYFRHTEDAPQFNTFETEGQAIITPVFNRAHLVGASFSNAFGDITLRAELGYTFDRGLSSRNATNPSLIDQADSIAYVVGVDWYGIDDTLVTVQFFQDRILDAAPSNRRKVDNFVTAALNRSFENDTIRLGVRALTNLADDDVMVQAEGGYELADNLAIIVETAVFFGDRNGVFGQFKQESRISIGLRFGL